jgi:hypothetical protein
LNLPIINQNLIGVAIFVPHYIAFRLIFNYIKKKQLAWLKKDGKLIHTKFACFVQLINFQTVSELSGLIPRIGIKVEWLNPDTGKTITFQSEPIATMFRWVKPEETGMPMVNAYLAEHPEGIPVYIDPDNLRMYLVDLSWFDGKKLTEQNTLYNQMKGKY